METTPTPESSTQSPRRGRSVWRRVASAAAWTFGGLAVLIVLVLAGISLVLSPERLTRMVRDYGSDYLVDGRVEVERVDLSIWSTFPHAELTVDSLKIVNNRLPDDYADVVAVSRFSGRVNLAALLIGRISVGHAIIDHPEVTLWTGADSTLNSLSILPASEPNPDDSGLLLLPDIRITRFAINGPARLRYISEPDSLDVGVALRRTALDGRDLTPQYALNVDGDLSALRPWLGDAALPLTFMADGGIGWEPSRPLAMSLHDFRLGVDSLLTQTSMRADFSDGIRVDELDFELMPLSLSRLAELASELPQLKGSVPAIRSDAALTMKARLQKPYVFNPDTLLMPALEAEVEIDDAPLNIPAYYLTLDKLGLKLLANISDGGLDCSTVELKRLKVEFPASDFTLTGRASNLGSDPAAQGCFKGVVNFSNLNPRLWTLLGMRLRGHLDADVDFNLHLSDLTPKTFHRLKLGGRANLTRFEALIPADSVAAGVTAARLDFGSANSYKGVDSLLTVAVKVDSAWAYLPELTAELKELAMGVGVSNTAGTVDTTTVTPMGAKLTLKSLKYRSAADSARALVAGLEGSLSLTRYNGGSRAPRIGAGLTARRIVYADGFNRASLRGIDIAASGYTTPRKKRDANRLRRKLTAADSARMAARRDSMILAAGKYERLDLDVDRSMVTLLRRWHLTGHLRARGGRLMTPMFPLRTRLTALDMNFNADSLMLNSMAIKAGRSDFRLNGSVTNIQRALGRRNSTSPLRMRLELNSDTININQLTQTAFRGAAFMAKADSVSAVTAGLALEADDSRLEAAAEADASDELMAIVVPMNVDARIGLAAKNIVYSTMELKDFGGEILVANGAANLRDLHASTDIGSVDLNMLYYAPTRSDVAFGLGLDLNRFNIGRVTELIPTLDSIMPILNTLGGIVDVGIAATTPVDSALNVKLPELRAMVRMSGDSLRVLDEQTFKTISKWLLFHDKHKNMIDHMDVQLAVENNQLTLYPFMFDFDRYRIGVMGNNDMNLNLDYHVSILKSPVPFKFGVNIKGTADKMKIRLGRARFKENMAAETRQLSDTLRLNLAREIRDVFNRGAKAARLAPLDVRRPSSLPDLDAGADTISPADSLYFIKQGLIEVLVVAGEDAKK